MLQNTESARVSIPAQLVEIQKGKEKEKKSSDEPTPVIPSSSLSALSEEKTDASSSSSSPPSPPLSSTGNASSIPHHVEFKYTWRTDLAATIDYWEGE